MREIIEKDILQIRELLQGVIGDSDYRHIERMGGLTNHTYKTEMQDGQTYVVRLPGEGTEELIDRKAERVSTQLACDLGIDAQLIHFGNEGQKITRYIDGAKTLAATDFKDPKILGMAAAVLRILHTSGADTKVPFDVFDMAAGYERIIYDNEGTFFDGYSEMKAKIMKIRNYVNGNSVVSLVPCHNDPLCENWVFGQNGKLYLIDWEYAGMNDGMWDLADISIEAALAEEQEETLLKCYFGREPERNESMRFHANQLYLDFLWALWGKARAPFDGKVMEEYGLERYIRLKKNLDRFLDTYSQGC